jgi:hypothetical protein
VLHSGIVVQPLRHFDRGNDSTEALILCDRGTNARCAGSPQTEQAGAHQEAVVGSGATVIARPSMSFFSMRAEAPLAA